MRVLQLTSYPIQPRRHGGQRRAGAIADAYRRSGADCRRAELWAPELYPGAGRAGLLPAGRATRRALIDIDPRADLKLAGLLLGDRQARAALVNAWRRHRPEVVQFEQPFLWPAARALLEAGEVPPAYLVYSSQNVEADMKEWIYRQALPGADAAEASGRAREIEADLVARADLVVAVTDADAARFRDAGARRLAVVPNGSDPRTARPERLAHWREQMRRWGWARFAAFVSSSHWPNFAGLLDLVGPELQFLPPDAGLLAIGGVSFLIDAERSLRPAVDLGRLRTVRDADDDDLAALLELAGVILLPINAGGGSNLKTVEALLTGRPIVATPFAFRAYEAHRGRPQVALADDRRAFRQAVQRSILSPPPPAGPLDDELLALTWPRLGERFVAAVRAVLGGWQKEVA